MKMKKIALSLASIAFLAMPSYILADDAEATEEYQFPVNISGELIGNYGVYKNAGETYNPEQNTDGSNKRHNIGTKSLQEVKAKLYLNQELADSVSWHGELDFNHDWAAVEGYKKTRINSQYDWLRELYVDIAVDKFSFRVGKQQVVWGKADGVKFLDIINPTDFRHWGQDSMENSRIPLWMVNAEYAINDNSSFQVVYVPQVNVTNQIPGLNDIETGDQGQQFVPLGTDTLFGQTNGFYNIGPEMGSVAGAFNQAFNVAFTGAPATNPNMLAGFSGMTVSSFTQVPDVGAMMVAKGAAAANVNALGLSANGGVDGFAVLNGNQMLSNTVNLPAPNGIGASTNLFGQTINTSNPTTMFDYMGDTTFATFDAFVGMGTKYIKKHARNDFKNGNIGFKYAGTNDDIGLNYTFNYYYHYDNNPAFDVSWASANGAALTTQATNNDFNALGANVGANVAEGSALSAGAVARTKTMSLLKADGTAYNYSVDGPANMVFTEKQNRINTFGTSFDYAIDNDFAPVIVRSEIVYDKGTLQPVVDLGKLAYGDLAGAFTNQKADFLNYVVGLDMTVLTNLFMSFQFMDKWNLDYVDAEVKYDGNSRAYSKHTANPATMSLANGFKKAEEHQIMYTFFLSRPFLEGDALRVNNIILLENDNGGYWDRLDFEYSYSDNVILTGALNQYGGDKFGVFGQFANSSNVQLGFKYIF